MSLKSGKKLTKQEELLLQDFSRNVSTKSSALFYGNAVIVSIIPICKSHLFSSSATSTTAAKRVCYSSLPRQSLLSLCLPFLSFPPAPFFPSFSTSFPATEPYLLLHLRDAFAGVRSNSVHDTFGTCPFRYTKFPVSYTHLTLPTIYSV